MLEVSGLTVNYGPVRAVDGLDFSVDEGCVALLGPNGAGKTSTLRALSKLVPSRGTIRFDGKDLRHVSAQRVARLGLIHVPEGRRVFPTLSVHENLQVGTTAAKGRRASFTIDEIYDLFPALIPLRDRDGWSLSGGELQMVAIGRALLAAPRLLMLDEPSLGLAPIVTAIVYEALNEATRNFPVLLVEQNTTVALSLSQRAMILVHGTIALQGTSDTMRDRGAMLATFLGQTVAPNVDGATPDVAKPS
ncbi:MAG: ABC transporter ATP-binding protein [Ilumatobacteraceae bacterium]